MAIDYEDLFDMIGEIVQRINEYEAIYAALDTDEAEIEADFNSTGNIRLYEGWHPRFESFKSTVEGWISELISEVEEILMDPELVLEEYRLGSSPTLIDVLKEMYRHMVDTAYYVTGNSPGGGTTTYDTFNSEVGQLCRTTTIDGYSPPIGSGGISNPEYLGATSQLQPAQEIYTFECISDSQQNGITPGTESWVWRSQYPKNSSYSWENEGSGNGPNIQSAEGNSLVSGGGLDQFSNDVPSGWTVYAGTAGTDFEEEIAGPFMRANQTSSLKFISGTGVAGSIEQQVYVERMRAYQIGVWVYLDNAAPTDPNLQLLLELFDGTDPADKTYAQFTEADTAWRQGWALLTMTAVMDNERVGDETLLRITATAIAGHDIYCQNAFITPITYHGGIGVCIASGVENFLVGDRITVTAATTGSGVFQTFFRKAFGVQLPSSGTTLIADSKAT